MADGSTIAPWVAIGLIAVGQIYTIGRNHTRGDTKVTENRTEVDSDIRLIKAQLADPIYGLQAIKSEISQMRTNCAGVTGEFKTRISHSEDEIKQLRKGRQPS